ncbi:MAG: hypothetical protein QF819_10335 [Gemmatimonadota bacterium]|nr:hypothetical protein [Gemmatimonadota bacterium]MDP6529553.1 hypothetical protein [Gemmatimonadota bacterium]MDP6803547.1 hypothetical protein [Gemmatimonadota bacterium]MDP7031923.1 hypothetical protein [Gemmatimonadota bacterium]
MTGCGGGGDPGESKPLVFTGALPNRDLEAQGWVRRNLSDPSRVDEVVELYESLGHEVRIEKLGPEDFADACESCALSVCSSYVMIYTRPPKA